MQKPRPHPDWKNQMKKLTEKTVAEYMRLDAELTENEKVIDGVTSMGSDLKNKVFGQWAAAKKSGQRAVRSARLRDEARGGRALNTLFFRSDPPTSSGPNLADLSPLTRHRISLPQQHIASGNACTYIYSSTHKRDNPVGGRAAIPLPQAVDSGCSRGVRGEGCRVHRDEACGGGCQSLTLN
jgi:hypothetical protein